MHLQRLMNKWPFAHVQYKIYIGSASLTTPWELMMPMGKKNIAKVKDLFSTLNLFD